MSRIERTPEQIEAMQAGPFDEAVALEMALQDERWGLAVASENSWSQWLLILGREFGEAQCAAGNVIWDGMTRDHLRELRLELVQIAAVAAQIAKVVDDAIASTPEAPS